MTTRRRAAHPSATGARKRHSPAAPVAAATRFASSMPPAQSSAGQGAMFGHLAPRCTVPPTRRASLGAADTAASPRPRAAAMTLGCRPPEHGRTTRGRPRTAPAGGLTRSVVRMGRQRLDAATEPGRDALGHVGRKLRLPVDGRLPPGQLEAVGHEYGRRRRERRRSLDAPARTRSDEDVESHARGVCVAVRSSVLASGQSRS